MRRYSRITGTGSYLPPRRLSNADLVLELAAKGVETSDDWIVERTGIRARHFADASMFSSDLALEAAKHALEAAKVLPTDIDLIIVARPRRTWCSHPPPAFFSTNSVLRAVPRSTCRRCAAASFMR